MILTESSISVGDNDSLPSSAHRNSSRAGRSKLGRSNSIKNLISFYEATYSKKLKDPRCQLGQTNTNNNTLNNQQNKIDYQRQISSPIMSHSNSLSSYHQSLHLNNRSKIGYLNLPASSPLSSPGFSPSSSSSSSTEKLSCYNSSFNSESLISKKEGSQTKEIQSPSLLW